MSEGRSTILVRVFGQDAPGITAGLMDVLSAGNCELYDVEQVVIRDRLSLNVLISVPDDQTTVRDVLFYATERRLTADFEPVADVPAPSRNRFAVSVIGARVTPQAFGAISRAIAETGGNIDSIERLSRYPVVSYELAVSGGDQHAMRTALLETSAIHDIDVAVQAEGIARRSKRLVVMDVDSTLIQDEVIELLAAAAGKRDEVAAITTRAMAGETDFTLALEQRVRLLAGLSVSVLDEVAAKIRLTPGARTFVRTLKRMGMKVGILSGGFTWFTDRLAADLGLDHSYANELEIEDGRLTGRITGTMIDR
ncbi:MAG: phosphoserine phosphatase SerB, partial [Acidimicrobiia bacterium]